ncbi:MAG: catechol 2,3-dioxygenase [Thermoplasmata archaeon]|nr:catechol 2,3-dioxygenase [Thermoplasmata archaeon]
MTLRGSRKAKPENDAIPNPTMTLSKLPASARMGEVTLAVHDLERSLAYYHDVLGFRILAQGGDEARVGGDAPLLRLVEERDAKPRPRSVSGLYHVAYLLPTRADLGRLIKKVAQERIPVQGASDHLVSEALYLGDPDGHGIEIYADRPRDTWKWRNATLHMATEPMDVAGVIAAAGDGTWAGVPEGAVVGHVHLNVGDVEEAEAFYRDAVGFDVTVNIPSASFLSAGGYHHHLAVNGWEGIGAPPAPKGTLGLREYEILVPDEEALRDFAKRAGVDVSDTAAARDPSGNALRVRIAR